MTETTDDTTDQIGTDRLNDLAEEHGIDSRRCASWSRPRTRSAGSAGGARTR